MHLKKSVFSGRKIILIGDRVKEVKISSLLISPREVLTLPSLDKNDVVSHPLCSFGFPRGICEMWKSQSVRQSKQGKRGDECFSSTMDRVDYRQAFRNVRPPQINESLPLIFFLSLNISVNGLSCAIYWDNRQKALELFKWFWLHGNFCAGETFIG